jgi:hypothetical protein
MRGSSVASILAATLIATAPAGALAHGHGGSGHHGSRHAGGFAFVPIAPRIAPPGFFSPVIPGSPWAPGPPPWSWGAPGPQPGWSGPPHAGLVLGGPLPGGVASPDTTGSEAARESDLEQQIGALPPPPDAPARGAAQAPDPSASEGDSGWQPL